MGLCKIKLRTAQSIGTNINKPLERLIDTHGIKRNFTLPSVYY